MTPEDQAAALWTEACEAWEADMLNPRNDISVHVTRRVAAALREAVAAETEACARIVEWCSCWPDKSLGYAAQLRHRAAAAPTGSAP